MTTPTESAIFASGFAALTNPIWFTWLPLIWQGLVGLGGGVLIFYMVLNKRTEWKLKQYELEQIEKEL